MNSPLNPNLSSTGLMSLFRSARETVPVRSASLEEVHELIRGDNLQNQTQRIHEAWVKAQRIGEDPKQAIKSLKLELPAITPAGEFTARAAGNLKSRSGCLVIDVDDLGVNQAEQLRSQLTNDPHILLAFVSPSGMGVKILLRVDPGMSHAESYANAARYLEEQFNLSPDPSGKDVSRLTFLCHDAAAIMNPEATPVPSSEDRNRIPVSKRNSLNTHDEARRIRGALSAIPSEERDTWLKIGFAIHSWDSSDAGYAIWDAWSKTSESKYNAADQRRTWESMDDNRSSSVTLGTLFGLASNYGWLEDNGMTNRRRSGQEQEPASMKLRAEVVLPSALADTSGYDFAKAIVQTLSMVNDSRQPRYVNHGGVFSTVRGAGREARLEAVNEHVIRTELQEHIRFVKRVKRDRGKVVSELVGEIPVQIAKDIAKAPAIAQGLPRVSGLVHSPLLDPLGQIHTNGFVERLELYIAAGSWRIDNPPVKDAADRLMDLLGDFLFVSTEDKSRLLASLFQPALVLGGHTERGPMMLVSADAPSAGKGACTNLRALIYGQPLAVLSQRESGVGGLDEAICGEIMAGRVFVSLDNLRGKLGSPFIESMLTESSVSCRIAYRAPKLVDVTRTCLSATSNGVTLTNDLALRTNPIRIRKQPEGYRFAHPQIFSWVEENRGPLLSAIFSILRDWSQNGARRAQTDWNGHFRDFWNVVDHLLPSYFNLPMPTRGLKGAVASTTSPACVLLRELSLALANRNQLGNSLAAVELLRIAGDEAIRWRDQVVPIDDDHSLEAMAGDFAKSAKSLFEHGGVFEIEDFQVRKHSERMARSGEGGPRLQNRYTFSRLCHTRETGEAARPATPASNFQESSGNSMEKPRTHGRAGVDLAGPHTESHF